MILFVLRGRIASRVSFDQNFGEPISFKQEAFQYNPVRDGELRALTAPMVQYCPSHLTKIRPWLICRNLDACLRRRFAIPMAKCGWQLQHRRGLPGDQPSDLHNLS